MNAGRNFCVYWCWIERPSQQNNFNQIPMKTLFYTKTLIALAVAIAAAAATISQAQEQPIPPPAAENALPANIVPGTPLAEVVKMVQAGVDVGTVRSYILNSQSAFNLDADKIMFLKDVGVPNDLVNAMMDRDKVLYAATVTPPPAPAPMPAPVAVTATAPDTAPPPTQVTVNYFYDTLTPYGSWVTVDGYGRCWRPTTAVYDAGWHPYCDHGHWVYTDCGWYWDSDYSWGATFHYGRWFQHPHWGWCWYPDTVWAPSWVTWRSGGDYCGWAPLPPFAVYQPGIGFYYHGASVSVGFNFGLAANCFVFLSPSHFCDYHPRSYCVAPTHVTQIYNQTTVINNYNVHNTTIINHGIPVDHISTAAHHSIEPVQISSLPNAGQHGWRGEGWQHSVQNLSGSHNSSQTPNNGNIPLHNTPGVRANANNTSGPILHENYNSSLTGMTQGTSHPDTLHSGAQQNYTGQANNNNHSQSSSLPQHYYSGQPATGNTHSLSQPNSGTGNATTYDHRVTQNNGPAGYVEHGQTQTTHDYNNNNSANSASQQHGAAQLQQHQLNGVQPSSANSQGQPHSSNTGSSGGSSTSSGNTSSQGKQNQQNQPNH